MQGYAYEAAITHLTRCTAASQLPSGSASPRADMTAARILQMALVPRTVVIHIALLMGCSEAVARHGSACSDNGLLMTSCHQDVTGL